MIKTRELLGVKTDFETELAKAYKTLLGDEFDFETFFDQVEFTCGHCRQEGLENLENSEYRNKLVYLNRNIKLYKTYCNFISDEELEYATPEQIQKYIDYNQFKESSLIYLLNLNSKNFIRYKIIRLYSWYCLQLKPNVPSGEEKVELFNKAKAYIKKVIMCEELEDKNTYFFI